MNEAALTIVSGREIQKQGMALGQLAELLNHAWPVTATAHFSNETADADMLRRNYVTGCVMMSAGSFLTMNCLHWGLIAKSVISHP